MPVHKSPARDWPTTAVNGHQVNLKAELEIELVHKKLNELKENEVMYLTKAISDLTELLKAEGRTVRLLSKQP